MSKGVKIGIGVFFIIAAIVAIIYILSDKKTSDAVSAGIFSITNRPGAKRDEV